MAIQKINLGTEPHGVGGDSYRTANDKINKNFEEVSANITNVDEKYSNTEVKITEEVARAKQVEDELKSNLEKEVSRAVSAEADILGVVESESKARTAESIRINEAQTQLKGFVDSEVDKLKLEDTSIKTDLDKTHRYAVMSQTLGLGSKFYDKDGQPLSGGKVYTYEAGTSTPSDTYKDAEFSIPNTNPIVLDETGGADVFLKGTYRFRIFDKNEVFIEEQGDVNQPASLASFDRFSKSLESYKQGIDLNLETLKEKTLVVESIADLSTIKNPKDGLRVYVKSYHAGFDMGGGYFTYDSSKASVNDKGNIINGWVRKVSDGYYSVQNFGAVGNSDHASYKDHEAFRAVSKAIEGKISGKVVIHIPSSSGEYVVGRQYFSTGMGTKTLEQEQILYVSTPENNNLTVHLRSDNAEIILRNSLKFGTFDRVTDERKDVEQPFYSGTSSFATEKDKVYIAQLGFMFDFLNVKELIATGNLRLNGNKKNQIWGGRYGDTGWQLPAYGFHYIGVKKHFIENIETSNHCLDGFYIGAFSQWENPDYHDVSLKGVLNNVFSNDNARQGLSLCGGQNITFNNCSFNRTGLRDTEYWSLPSQGVDIEPERFPVRRVVFNQCDFIDNNMGIGAIVGDSKWVTFNNCNISGGKTLWIDKPAYTFNSCYINGFIEQAYNSNNEALKLKFNDCVLTYDHSKNTLWDDGYSYVLSASGRNPVFNNCTFDLINSGFVFDNYDFSAENPQGTKMTDCTINVYDGTQNLFMRAGPYKNITINDYRTDPSVILPVQGSGLLKNVKVHCMKEGATSNILNYNSPKQQIFSNDVLYSGEPELPAKFEYKSVKENATYVRDLPKYTYSKTLTPIDEVGVLNRVGDRIYCLDPTKNIDYWICTKDGDATTSAWKAIQANEVPQT